MDCNSVDMRILDEVAEKVIRGGMKIAAVEGAGFGLGGVITIVPDLGILAGITLRTIQKLSLLYGFEFNTDDETAELWIAAATALVWTSAAKCWRKKSSTNLCRV